MNKLLVSISDIKQGIAEYYGVSWVFNILEYGPWVDSIATTASRIIIDGLEINIYQCETVIGLALWYSSTSQVGTYIGHPDAIGHEIQKLYYRLYNETNYMYEREQQVSSKTYNS